MSQWEGYQRWKTLSYVPQTSLRKRMTYCTSSWECWLPSDMSPLWGLPHLKKAVLPKVASSRGIHLLMSDWCEGVEVCLVFISSEEPFWRDISVPELHVRYVETSLGLYVDQRLCLILLPYLSSIGIDPQNTLVTILPANFCLFSRECNLQYHPLSGLCKPEIWKIP